MRSPRSATSAGVAMAVLGFLLLGLVWARAAEQGFSTAAFPVALTGGLAGLGLVVMGTATTVVVAQRLATARRAREMARVQEELDTLIRAVVTAGPGETIEDVTTVDVSARTVRRRVERKPLGPAEPPTGAPPPEVDVPLPPPGPPPASGLRRPSAPASAPAPPTVPRRPVVDSEHAPPSPAVEDNPWARPSPRAQPPVDDQVRTLLHGVDALGPVEQAAVAEHFPTASALRSASLAQLREVPGLSEAQARRLHDALR